MMELVRSPSPACGMSGHADMVWISGGTFRMGSDRHYAEIAPDPKDDIRSPRKVLKGGSHLCTANYCRRCRPATHHPEPVDTSTSHVGLRCIIRQAGAAP